MVVELSPAGSVLQGQKLPPGSTAVPSCPRSTATNTVSGKCSWLQLAPYCRYYYRLLIVQLVTTGPIPMSLILPPANTAVPVLQKLILSPVSTAGLSWFSFARANTVYC